MSLFLQEHLNGISHLSRAVLLLSRLHKANSRFRDVLIRVHFRADSQHQLEVQTFELI